MVRADYEAALKERDARIAGLEGEIVEAVKAAEGAEKLRAEMDELRRRGDEDASASSSSSPGRAVKAARALLPDHDSDIEKLKAAEPWLFLPSPAPPRRRPARRDCHARAPPARTSPRR